MSFRLYGISFIEKALDSPGLLSVVACLRGFFHRTVKIESK